jgi:hypothetical protein
MRASGEDTSDHVYLDMVRVREWLEAIGENKSSRRLVATRTPEILWSWNGLIHQEFGRFVHSHRVPTTQPRQECL